MDQISAGGVAFRWKDSQPEIAIVSVKPKLRWQLPKGIVDPGESPEVTAVREVREEAGVETDRLALIETIEYWYRSVRNGKPVRYHKFVHFYLLQYRRGDVSEHGHEIIYYCDNRFVKLDDTADDTAGSHQGHLTCRQYVNRSVLSMVNKSRGETERDENGTKEM